MVSKVLLKKDDCQTVVSIGDGRFFLRYGVMDYVLAAPKEGEEQSDEEEEFVTAYEEIFEGNAEEASARQQELNDTVVNPVRAEKIREVENTAASDSVKKFKWLGEETCWWDSEQRASIRASLEARPDGELCYLEVNGQIYEMSKEKALAILDKIEVYASDCHLTVCVAINEIGELQSVAEVRAFVVEFPEIVVITETDITDEAEEAES